MKDYFRVQELCPRLLRITDIADTHLYLVRGDHASALLDTGVGCGDLAALAARLTDKPLTVLISHGHVDHAIGAGQFSRVYMSPLDREVYAEHSLPENRLDYVHGTFGGRPANPDTAFVTAELLHDPKPFSEFAPLAPGDRFELGCVTVEVLPGRGHTPGCVTFLLPELRTLLTGDACNPCTLLVERTCPTVTEYREMLRSLKAMTDGKYDRVLLNHGETGETAVNIIDTVLAVCGDILSGSADNQPGEGFHGEPMCIAKTMVTDPATGDFCRADGKEGNIIYDPARVR